MSAVAAWVGGRPISVTEVDDRLASLRAGPLAARLPAPDTAEGRTMRRWMVQVLTTEAVIDEEFGRYVGPPPSAPTYRTSTPSEDVRHFTLADALRTGGVVAAVTAAHPLAAPLRDRVAPPRPAEGVRGYYDRNRDRYPGPYEEARGPIEALLAAHEREQRFARWLEERCAALVRLAPGFEHPGDPAHPDATHRH